MYHTILHATDLSENHFELCERANKIAQHFNSTLHLLHVIDIPTSSQFAQGLGFMELMNPSKENARTVLKLIGEALSISNKRLHVEIGSINTSILNLSDAIGASLIIIGAHESKGISSLLGRNAQWLMDHASCDILTLRPNS